MRIVGFVSFVCYWSMYMTNKELGVLMDRPMINFKKANEKLGEHFSGKGQSPTLFCCEINHSLSIDQQLGTQEAKEVNSNRKKLRSIASSHSYIVWTARNCTERLPRWQNGYKRYIWKKRKLSSSIAFSYWCWWQISEASSGNNSYRNALYTSKETQNDLIALCGELIKRNITKRIQKLDSFLLLLMKPQTQPTMNSYLWVLDLSRKVFQMRGFLRFMSEAIAMVIIGQITDWQLDLQLMRGQT